MKLNAVGLGLQEPRLAVDGTSRRNFLEVATLGAVAGLASLNLINDLFAAEPPKKASRVVNYYCGHISGVRGANKKPMDDIGYRILDSVTIDQWESRIMTAPAHPEATFSANNTYLRDIARLDYAVESANNPSYKPSILEEFDPAFLMLRKSGRKITQAEVEEFGKKIESGRLASMFCTATVADLPVTNRILRPKLGKSGHLSLPQGLELINSFLKDVNYSRLNKADRERIEDVFIKELYGNENGELLIKAFTNLDKGKETEHYNCDARRDFIRPIAVKQGLIEAEE